MANLCCKDSGRIQAGEWDAAKISSTILILRKNGRMEFGRQLGVFTTAFLH